MISYMMADAHSFIVVSPKEVGRDLEPYLPWYSYREQEYDAKENNRMIDGLALNIYSLKGRLAGRKLVVGGRNRAKQEQFLRIASELMSSKFQQVSEKMSKA